jgi:hypothetical protein
MSIVIENLKTHTPTHSHNVKSHKLESPIREGTLRKFLNIPSKLKNFIKGY